MGSASLIVICFNWPLLNYIYGLDKGNDVYLPLFNISIFLIVAGVILLFILPFVVLNVYRYAVAGLIYFSALTSYFSVKYGIMYDRTLAESTFGTNFNEAQQYLTTEFLLYNVMWILLSGLGLLVVQIPKMSIRQRLRIVSELLIFVLVGIFIIGAFFYKDYASLLRNHRQIRHMVLPISPVYESVKYVVNSVSPKKRSFESLGTTATKQKDKKKKLLVFVLGETARSDHFSLNGYMGNETNPELKKLPVISFDDIFSCGTATAVSVPCIFSDLGRKGFDIGRASSRSNLLDIAKSAGYKVIWIDNNSGCQGVCDRVGQLDMATLRSNKYCSGTVCYDEILVEALKKVASNDEDQLIVLHMIGSHGPAYHLRYPPEFNRFVPSCTTNNLSACTKKQIINTYDNTILYADYILSEVVKYLEEKSRVIDTAMIYVSDHGESLGENGIYLHSLPYSFAPRAQIKVPLLMWFSDPYKKSFGAANLFNTFSIPCRYSHDYIFSTALSMLEITTPEYSRELDIFNSDISKCN